MALWGKSKHYRLTEIQHRHFNLTAAPCGLGLDMENIITDVIARVPSVVETVGAKLPRGFPAELFESVAGGLHRAINDLEKVPAS
jgi:serine/threonine-protein kinase HipA